MLKIGFTGTRTTLPSAQERALRRVLREHGHAELHHGDCVGADAAAHRIGKDLGWRVVVHPALVPPALRAFSKDPDETRDARPPLERNLDIVDETERLIAAPALMRPEIRSGTWQTIRAAQKRGRPITVVWPNGQCEAGYGPSRPDRRAPVAQPPTTPNP